MTSEIISAHLRKPTGTFLGNFVFCKIPLGKYIFGKIPLGKYIFWKMPLGKYIFGKMPLAKIPLAFLHILLSN